MVLTGGTALMPVQEVTNDSEDPTREGKQFTVMVFAGLALAGLLHHLTATARARLWLGRLPFKVDGFDRTLGLGMAVTKAEVEVTFADTAATRDLVVELVRARFPETTTVVARGNGLAIIVEWLDTQANNGPIAGWFRKVVNRVLRSVHRGYPIAHVTLKSLKTSDFDFGSGD